MTTSAPTPERFAISSNGSRTNPSILSSEIARIRALIGSLCSIGSIIKLWHTSTDRARPSGLRAKIVSRVGRQAFGVEHLSSMFKAIFFDALGTLIYLTRTVGHHYAFAGAEVGLSLDPQQLDDAFYSAWQKL